MTEAPSYEAYLDGFVTPADLAYLEDAAVARELVTLGLGGSGAGASVLSAREWAARRGAAADVGGGGGGSSSSPPPAPPRPLACLGAALAGRPLLSALAAREEALRSGALACILFLRERNARGQEVSGYIDVAARLQGDELEDVFSGAARLQPRASDLSYYNHATGVHASTPSPSWAVATEGAAGLVFRNKRDRKTVCVDPAASPGECSARTALRTHEALQAVLIDHWLRRGAEAGL